MFDSLAEKLLGNWKELADSQHGERVRGHSLFLNETSSVWIHSSCLNELAEDVLLKSRSAIELLCGCDK